MKTNPFEVKIEEKNNTVGRGKLALWISVLTVIIFSSAYLYYSYQNSNQRPPSLEALTEMGFIVGANDLGFKYKEEQINAINSRISPTMLRDNVLDNYFYSKEEISFYDIIMSIKAQDPENFQAQIIHYNTEEKNFVAFPAGIFKNSNNLRELKLRDGNTEFLELQEYKVPAYSVFMVFSNKKFFTFLESNSEEGFYNLKSIRENPNNYNFDIDNREAGWHLAVLTKAMAKEISDNCRNGIDGFWLYNQEEQNPKKAFGNLAVSATEITILENYLMWINKTVDKGACSTQ
jgi:hypothetical protein